MTERRSAGADAIDLTVARLLTVGTYLSVALLAGGVLLMAAVGRSPLDAPAHDFDPGALFGDLLAGRPDVILTPHIAGWTFESHVKINVALVEKIKALQLE